ncbi:MAG: hypothetical protein U5S82_20390 [Gammaproteobacteria bacterium]|nr:hypothetical protein [Gammaproteobacteria bacterium]
MDTEKHSELRMWAVVLAMVGGLVLAGVLFAPPLLQEGITALDEGVGLKDAALWSFVATVVLFIVFAIAAGDGLIGEIQFMLVGFFLFFVIITLLIAWVF